jgi:hypothetical protein
MQWPTTVLVFPLFPTLLELIKKRATPYPHAITTSDIPVSYTVGGLEIETSQKKKPIEIEISILELLKSTFYEKYACF